MSLRQARRTLLRAEDNCQFIEAADFVRRATSRQLLVRADDPIAAVKGLLDPSSGARFLVEIEKLESFTSEEELDFKHPLPSHKQK